MGLRGGAEFHLADLPGYGYAERSHGERRAWAEHIEGYLQRRASLRGVAVLVDARRGVEDEELQLLDWLRLIHRPVVVVATKADKVPRAELDRSLAAIARVTRAPVVATSGDTGTGREALLKAILRLLPPPATEAQPGTAPAPEAMSGDDAGTVAAHVPTR